jgi:CBS domain-containing protein
MYTVSDAMTPNPVTLRETDHLGIAEALMRGGLEPIRHLPVLSGGKLVGILTQIDVLRAHEGRDAGRVERTPVSAAMTRRVRSVRPGTPLRRAVQLLLRLKVGGLPVIDAQRSVVGILTTTDVLRLALKLVTGLDRYADTRHRASAPDQALWAELGMAGLASAALIGRPRRDPAGPTR